MLARTDGQYAIEHRLPVLSTDWIEDNHQRWIGGGDIETDVCRHVGDASLTDE